MTVPICKLALIFLNLLLHPEVKIFETFRLINRSGELHAWNGSTLVKIIDQPEMLEEVIEVVGNNNSDSRSDQSRSHQVPSSYVFYTVSNESSSRNFYPDRGTLPFIPADPRMQIPQGKIKECNEGPDSALVKVLARMKLAFQNLKQIFKRPRSSANLT